MKRTTLALTGFALLASAGLLIASTPKRDDDGEKKGNYKHYQVIQMKNGKLTEFDTLLPSGANYSVETFLSDNGIDPKETDIVNVPLEHELAVEEFANISGNEHNKMIVKSEIRIETDDENGIEGNEIHENVEIICKMDDKGNMATKKIVNGKEVEMTPEEKEKLKIHHHIGDKSKLKNVMIMIDGNEYDMDKIHKEIIGKMHIELKDLDLDFELNGSMNIDSLMKVINEEMEKMHNELGEMKVIVKELKQEVDNDGKEEKVFIIEDGKKMEWDSKEGENIFAEIDSDGNEDFTIVIVTEGVDREKVKNSITSSEDKIDVQVYPNPTEGQFRLKFKQEEKAKTLIEITDLQGKTILKEDLEKFSGEFDKQFDLSKNGKGVYVVNVIQGKEKTTKRVVIK